MLDLGNVVVVHQACSHFLVKLPLELREQCYRAYLSTFQTAYGTPYVDTDVYFLPVLTGAHQYGYIYIQVLQLLSSCRQIHTEFRDLLFREHAYLVDPDIEDLVWFNTTQKFIRKAAITFSVQAGKNKADLAKSRVQQLAAAFENGRHLSELGIHLWGRWRDATDPEGILQEIGASFKVSRVWIVDNHVLFGAQFFTDEQLKALKCAVEGSIEGLDWQAIRGRAESRMSLMEKEADEDPEKYRLSKPQHSRQASVQTGVNEAETAAT